MSAFLAPLVRRQPLPCSPIPWAAGTASIRCHRRDRLADAKQMVVVTDRDSKVPARKRLRCRTGDLGAALDWAAAHAAARGFAGVTISCEPTGHRWRVLGQPTEDRSMPFVRVQPLVTSWSRRAEDLTVDKTDEKGAVLIARLTTQLRCYVPEPMNETRARPRHLGARREQLVR